MWVSLFFSPTLNLMRVKSFLARACAASLAAKSVARAAACAAGGAPSGRGRKYTLGFILRLSH